jgi:hypothetical protein
LAADLHEDAIAIDQAHPATKLVRFEPFVGVAPRAYLDLFTAPRRKDPGGRIVEFDRSTAVPRFAAGEQFRVDPNYPDREVVALKMFRDLVSEAGFSPPDFGEEEGKSGENEQKGASS